MSLKRNNIELHPKNSFEIKQNQQRTHKSPLIIDGKQLANKIYDKLIKNVQSFKQEFNRTPCLAVILCNTNKDSLLYTQLKTKKAKQLGIKSINYDLSNIMKQHSTTNNEHEIYLLQLIDKLNMDPEIDGILLQLPLTPNLMYATKNIVNQISPIKDVDGLCVENQSKLLYFSSSTTETNSSIKRAFNLTFNDITHTNCEQYINLPCTPLAVIHILEYLESDEHCFDFEIEGKNIVMVGRSHLVGCPLSLMLIHKNATVTVCHTFTVDLFKHCRNADIIIVATGNPNLITFECVKYNCIIIDIGINVIFDVGVSVDVDDMNIDGVVDGEVGKKRKRRIVGDVAFEEVKDMCCAITPVPGGVGPLTLAMLFQNTMRSAKCREYMKNDVCDNRNILYGNMLIEKSCL